MSDSEHPKTATSNWFASPRDDEERKFLSGSREHPQELASAGRVFLEFVRGFQGLGSLGRSGPHASRKGTGITSWPVNSATGLRARVTPL